MKVNYQKYIRSNDWQKKRKQFAASKAHDNCCYACGDISRLDLHHRTYKRLGNENIGIDLIYLCRTCHQTVHAQISPTNSLFGAAKRLRKKNIKAGNFIKIEVAPVQATNAPTHILRKKVNA